MNDPVLGEVTVSEETEVRPVAVLEVDGVLVLEDPVVPVTQVTVHAYGNKWTRQVRVPTAAPGIVARLAERFDIVWASAWSHNAHPALREVLLVPVDPGRGITAIDPDGLRAELDRHCPALLTRG